MNNNEKSFASSSPNDDIGKLLPKFSNLFGSIFFIAFLLVSSYVFRDYIHSVLRWVENQSDPIVFLILVGLYILVSLPIAWGYIVINIATGYLYGIKIGILVTFTSATLGIVIAHYLIKAFLVDYVKRLIANSNSGSILKKLQMLLNSKTDAFQLVFLSRLTPIPFGLQNSFFAISPMTTWHYLQASCLGLLPCQIINVYLGSTLRSMEEVFTDSSTATVGVVVLICQLVFIGIVVIFIVQKAREQLENMENQVEKMTSNTEMPNSLFQPDFEIIVISSKNEISDQVQSL